MAFLAPSQLLRSRLAFLVAASPQWLVAEEPTRLVLLAAA
jgi:hypothetical protein